MGVCVLEGSDSTRIGLDKDFLANRIVNTFRCSGNVELEVFILLLLFETLFFFFSTLFLSLLNICKNLVPFLPPLIFSLSQLFQLLPLAGGPHRSEEQPSELQQRFGFSY